MEVMKVIVSAEATKITKQVRRENAIKTMTPVYELIRQTASDSSAANTCTYSTFGLNVDRQFIKDVLEQQGYTVELNDIVDAQNRIIDTHIHITWPADFAP